MNCSKLIELARAAVEQLKFQFPYDVDKWVSDMGMMIENYHKHTAWSNLVQLDSATSESDFAQKLREYGCQCYFSGEHGFQGEWPYIYSFCKKNGFKFRYSTEAYWVKDRHEKDATNCHIVIIARTYRAIRKLNYILSMANVDGFYHKPRIDLDLLFQLDPEDVYVTSACLAGWKYEDAEDVWLKISKHFGDSFFLEYQSHNTPKQQEINRNILYMSQRHDIQTIIGLDTHVISQEDKVKRDNLLLRKHIKYAEEDGWHIDFPDGNTVFSRMQEQGILSDLEIVTAMMNTHIFLNGCEDIVIPTNFKIPIVPQYQNNSYDERVHAAKKILYKKYKQEPTHFQTQDRIDGLKYEVGEVVGSKTVDYFLTNHAIVNLATSDKYNGTLTTTSRGSAASFYSSKLFGFTTMDRFDSEVPMYPERFLTKERIVSSHQMPDIDYNVEKQEPFILATRELLGEEGCYPLLAVGKLGEKSGFKLYADINGIAPSIANEVSKNIERYNDTLKHLDDEDEKEAIDIEDFIEDKHHLEVFNASKPYQGIIDQAKCHACGHLIFNGDPEHKGVIGYGDIRYEIGLLRCVSESTGKSVIVACVEGKFLDQFGYVKNDYLIVDVVGIIRKLYNSIGRKVPTVQELREMVSNDDKTWELYEKGLTCCLNQCEKEATTKRVMKYRPKNIKELAAFIAAIRPGFKSLLGGFLERIEYTSGEPAIDLLLKDCFNYMLYQESLMKIFAYLGIDIKDSYDTIKKISKKKFEAEQLAQLEKILIEHWEKNVGNLDNFEPVYKVVKDSARYGFNAPHALAMAYDSLYEAWMKAHYPSRFYEETLNHYQAKDDKDKVSALMSEAVSGFGYTIGSYEYGLDNSRFVVDDEKKIIFPNLACIKGIGEQAVLSIMDIAKSGLDNFIEIFYATKGTKLNSSVFKSLVKIGYFKKYGSTKKLLKMIEIAETWFGTGNKGKKTLKKDEAEKIGLNREDILRYATDVLASGKTSSTQYSVFDFIGMAKLCSKDIADEEYGVAKLAKFQYEVLGYVDCVDAKIDTNYTFVLNLNTRYSPKFIGYCLANGKIMELKVHRKKNFRDKTIITAFENSPFQDGEILFLKKCKKQPKRFLVGDEWREDYDVMEWWVKDYSIVR